MAIDYTALAAELTAGHPVSGAYNANAQLAANQINALDIDSIRASISGADVFAATDPVEFGGLTTAKKAEWLAFCGITDHSPENNGLAHKFIEYVFGGASATETALALVRKKTVSRGSQLGLKELKGSHIQMARGEI